MNTATARLSTGRRVAAAIGSAAIALSLAVIPATPAAAAPGPFTGTEQLATTAKPKVFKFTAKADLNARKSASLNAKVLKVDAYRKGQLVPVVCQTSGGSAYGSKIWDRTSSGAFVPDAYVSTGRTGFHPDVPRCGKEIVTPPPPPTTGSARTFTTTASLDGRKAKRVSAKGYKVYAKGAKIKIKCQAYGAYAYGSPVWDKTTDDLWVPDAYVKTGATGFVKGMARCDNDPKPTNVPLPVHLDASQIAHARTIIAVGKGYGIPRRGWEVAIATAMQESTLRNLNGGDRDSVGLFQQRPSVGWGSISQCTNPVLAARAFYGKASHTGNPGLVDVRGWQDMSISRAAQAVQRSAYPDAYAKWAPLARALVAKYGDSTKAIR